MNILISWFLAFAMLLAACGDSTPITGTWRGNCDLTDYITEAVTAGDPSIEEYLDFKDLSFDVIFNFTEEGEVEMHVDEESAEVFLENMEDGMYNMMDNMLQDQLSDFGYSNDEIALVMGYDSYDVMIEDLIASLDMETTLIEPLMESLDLQGTYEYDAATGILTIRYDYGGEEEFQCEYSGEQLIITMEDDGMEFVIECEKE